MQMKIFLYLVVLFLSVTSSANDLMVQYEFDASAKVKSVVLSTLGRNTIVNDIKAGPVGIFIVNVTHDDKSTETLYVLQDTQHILRGSLYSPYITDKGQAHGSEYLEKKAEQNKTRMEMIGRINVPVKQQSKLPIIEPFFKKEEFITSQKKSRSIFTVGFDENAHYAKLEKASTVLYGNSEKYLYVYYDHYCPACMKLNDDIIQYANEFDVGVKFVPVSFLGGEDGIGKATMVLMAPEDKRYERKQHFMGNAKLSTLLSEEERTKEIFSSDQYIQAVQNYHVNKDLFWELPKTATPAFVFKSNTGVHAVVSTDTNNIRRMFESTIDSPVEQ